MAAKHTTTWIYDIRSNINNIHRIAFAVIFDTDFSWKYSRISNWQLWSKNTYNMRTPVQLYILLSFSALMGVFGRYAQTQCFSIMNRNFPLEMLVICWAYLPKPYFAKAFMLVNGACKPVCISRSDLQHILWTKALDACSQIYQNIHDIKPFQITKDQK